MNTHPFLGGALIGAVAGAAMSMAIAPKQQRAMKRAAVKAVKTAEHAVEDLADVMRG